MKEPRRSLRWHLLLLFSLYITQYLGISFILETLVAVLRRGGMPLERLGFVYLLGLFWGIKFLWAPVLDRYSLVKSGHFRGWLLILQSLLAISLLLTAGFDPQSGGPTVFFLCMFICFFSSSGDIAADALAYRLLTEEERGYGNAVKTGGGLLGYMLGGGVALMLYARLGWTLTLLILAAVTLLSLVQLIFLREPAHVPSRWEETGYLKRFYSYWTAPGRNRWLVLLVLYPLAISIAYGIIIPMLVDAGWSLARIGFIVNIAGALIGASAAMGAGWLIRKVGRRSMLVGTALAQGLGILLLLLPAWGRHDIFSVCLAVGALMFLHTLSATVMSTVMMDQTDNTSPATDLAMQHSLYQVVGFVASAVSVTFAGKFGYAATICAASGLAFLSLAASVKLYAPGTRRVGVSGAFSPAINKLEA